MSFVEIQGIEEVQERKLVPVDTYEFVVGSVKSEEEDGGWKFQLTCEAQGLDDPEDYQPVWHRIQTPSNSDDKEKKNAKMLFLKRFLVLAGIDISQGGFNEYELQGASFTAAVEAGEYEGRETRNLVIPPLPAED